MKEIKKVFKWDWEKNRMKREKILIILKKRLLGRYLDFHLFIFIFLFFILLLNKLESITSNLLLFIIYICFIPFVYFGLIPYLTNGFTLGGKIVGLEIRWYNYENKRIYKNPFQYIFRGILILFSSKSHSSNFLVEAYKINSLGQMPFEYKFNSTVVFINTNINFNQTIEYYEFEIIDYSLREEIYRVNKKIKFYYYLIAFLVALFLIVLSFIFNSTPSLEELPYPCVQTDSSNKK